MKGFPSLEAQLVRAIESGDFERALHLIEVGADPFAQIMLADLSAEAQERIGQVLARQGLPNMGENDG